MKKIQETAVREERSGGTRVSEERSADTGSAKKSQEKVKKGQKAQGSVKISSGYTKVCAEMSRKTVVCEVVF
jgi:hypothetical protein